MIQESDNNKATITIGTKGGGNSGPQIYGNRCLLQGGGVYVRGSDTNTNDNADKWK